MLIVFTAADMAEYEWVNPKSDKEPSSLSKFYHSTFDSQQARMAGII